jgi:YD repeat-containing protein
MNQRVARAARTLIVALLVATPLAGQQSPALGKGFSPDKVFDFQSGIDTVNTFNGNFSLHIPIGPSFPVNGGLSYALTLAYNSKAWDYELYGGTVHPGQMEVYSVPSRRSNAGMGWLLSLGRLLPPGSSTNHVVGSHWIYESPDGADHVFFPTLHDGDAAVPLIGNVKDVGYTRDGTYLRLLGLDLNFDTVIDQRVVEFPDGLVRTFDAVSGDLSRISDRYGNYVQLNRTTSVAGTPCPVGDAFAWTITDSQNARTNYVCFTALPYFDSTYDGQIERVVLAAPPDPASGSARTTTFTFQYQLRTLARSCNEAGHPPIPDVPVLVDITQNPGTAEAEFYNFTYNETNFNQAGAPTCQSGTMASYTLPTGATVSYGYRVWDTPTDALDGCQLPNGTWWLGYTGIATRTITGPSVAPATWTYFPSLSQHTERTMCEEFNPSLPIGIPPEYLTTVVTDPLGNVTEYFYSVWTWVTDTIFDANLNPLPPSNFSPRGFRGEEYGLPFTRTPGTQSDGRFLSRRVYTAAGYAANPKQPLRSFYVKYERDALNCGGDLDSACLDGNSRVSSERTVFHDDNNRYIDVDRDPLSFDGLGHLRAVSTGGNFDSSGGKTSYTAYNERTSEINPAVANDKVIDSGWYPGNFHMPGLDKAWVLETASRTSVSQNEKTVVTHSCYDPLTGSLRAQRNLAGTSRSPKDLLAIFTTDGGGNVVTERYAGGDVLANASTTLSLCAVASVPPAAETTITNTYDVGVRKTSQYAGASFLSLDLTIHWPTGLPLSSRDSAGVVTDVKYDGRSRLLSIRPAGQAWTSYTYSVVPAPPMVMVRQCPNGVGECPTSPLTESLYYFDGLGRFTEQRDRTGASERSAQWMTYDAMGRKTSTTSPIAVSTAASGTIPPGTPASILSYDVLGRAILQTLPDGSQTTWSYVGDRVKTRTSGIWTGVDGAPGAPGTQDSPAAVTEEYDGFGRLVSVKELSGPTTATNPIGAEIKTEYGYDVADRLTAVTMNRTPAGPVQRRIFDYDGRGFLDWESEPENGLTSYQYDSRGHVVSKTLSVPNSIFDLKYTYDGAERLAHVDGRNPLYDPGDPTQPQFRGLKDFVFGTSNLGTDLRNGKLVEARRYNYDPLATRNTGNYCVSDLYEYRDAAGRRTKGTTEIGLCYPDGFKIPLKSIEKSVSYNDLGLPSTVTYPMCENCGFPQPAVDRSGETRNYAYGRLTLLTGFLNDVSYWPNGMRYILSHSNGVQDTQMVGSMPRPTQIKFGLYDHCVQPTLTVQPGSTSVPAPGSPASLTVAATGTTPLTYRWYAQGTVDPIGSTPTITVNPQATTEYWVEVSNACGYAVSQTAEVTIGGCTPPSTGTIDAVTQPDGSWVLTPHPRARTSRTYQWKRLSDNQLLGTAETQPVGVLSQTTTFSLTITDCGSTTSNVTISVPFTVNTTLVATANATYSQVNVSWTAVPAAASYVVIRGFGGSWETVGTPTAPSFADTQVVGSRTYVYRVAARDGSNKLSNFSLSDVATTMGFAPVIAGAPVTSATADEMLLAVNKVREAVGWPALTWATLLLPGDPVATAGNTVTSRQILACRARINEALLALGASTPNYLDADLLQVAIKASHVQQILDATR